MARSLRLLALLVTFSGVGAAPCAAGYFDSLITPALEPSGGPASFCRLCQTCRKSFGNLTREGAVLLSRDQYYDSVLLNLCVFDPQTKKGQSILDLRKIDQSILNIADAFLGSGSALTASYLYSFILESQDLKSNSQSSETNDASLQLLNKASNRARLAQARLGIPVGPDQCKSPLESGDMNENLERTCDYLACRAWVPGKHGDSIRLEEDNLLLHSIAQLLAYTTRNDGKLGSNYHCTEDIPAYATRNDSKIDSNSHYYRQIFFDIINRIFHSSQDKAGLATSLSGDPSTARKIADTLLYAYQSINNLAYTYYTTTNTQQVNTERICALLPEKGLFVDFINIEAPPQVGRSLSARFALQLIEPAFASMLLATLALAKEAVRAGDRGSLCYLLSIAGRLAHFWFSQLEEGPSADRRRQYVRIAGFKAGLKTGSKPADACTWDVRYLGYEPALTQALDGTPFRFSLESGGRKGEGANPLAPETRRVQFFQRLWHAHQLLLGGILPWVGDARFVVYLGGGVMSEVSPYVFRDSFQSPTEHGRFWYETKVVVAEPSPEEFIMHAEQAQQRKISHEPNSLLKRAYEMVIKTIQSPNSNLVAPQLYMFLNMYYDGFPCIAYGSQRAKVCLKGTAASLSACDGSLFTCSHDVWDKPMLIGPSFPTDSSSRNPQSFQAMTSARHSGRRIKRYLDDLIVRSHPPVALGTQPGAAFVKIHSGRDATEPLFLWTLLEAPEGSILHIWSHGTVLPPTPTNDSQSNACEQPKSSGSLQDFLSRHVIGFSFANNKKDSLDPAFDGLMSGEELLQVGLRRRCGVGGSKPLELLSLGTCDSGITGTWSWAGISGFRRAAMLAGFRSLLVSLRPVIVAQNEQFFEAFYKKFYALRLNPIGIGLLGGNEFAKWGALRFAMTEARRASTSSACEVWLRKGLGIVCPTGDSDALTCEEICSEYFGFDYILIGDWT